MPRKRVDVDRAGDLFDDLYEVITELAANHWDVEKDVASCPCGCDDLIFEAMEALETLITDGYALVSKEDLAELRAADEAVRQANARATEAERRLARRTRRISSAVRAAVLERDKSLCRYCGVEAGPEAQMDHYDPEGPGTEDNLVVACGPCNIRKGNTRPRSLRNQKGMVLLGGKPATPPVLMLPWSR